jgi:hypothetical protein
VDVSVYYTIKQRSTEVRRALFFLLKRCFTALNDRIGASLSALPFYVHLHLTNAVLRAFGLQLCAAGRYGTNESLDLRKKDQAKG